jgi:nucleoside-diphosphate-sugar epimerase
LNVRRLTIGLTGSTGFVGRAIAEAALRAGHWVVPIKTPRLAVAERDVEAHLREQSRRPILDALVAEIRLGASDVIVHAAGLARPEGNASPDMTGANVVLPALVACAARLAGVRRLIHVSSAAVQGSLDPLDETMHHCPLTPYGRSKALGELHLRSLSAPAETVIFRPTSVQGTGRAITETLCQMMSRRWMLVSGDGEAPMPLALIDNVAAAAVRLSETADVPPVVLYPWEGLTLRRLIAVIGHAKPVTMPASIGRAAVAALLIAGRVSSTSAAFGRRLELLVKGQRQEAHGLPAIGFTPPVGHDGYRGLCRHADHAN